MTPDQNMLHETAEAVLALMQGLAAFRDRHDRLYAALMAARSDAPVPAKGAPATFCATPKDAYATATDLEKAVGAALAKRCQEIFWAQWDNDVQIDLARAAIGAMATSKVMALNSVLIHERDTARTEAAKLKASLDSWQTAHRIVTENAQWLRTTVEDLRGQLSAARDWMVPAKRDGLPSHLRDRLARLLVGREGVWSFTEEEGAVVNELIVWALKMPGGSAP